MRCQDYDYIEIACLYHYPVRLTLRDGRVVEGIAGDSGWNAQRQEVLSLTTDQGHETVLLADLLSLTVTVDNPHFQQVQFQ
ncbi:Rho-binding antiterminator [Ferrimonas balearica]|uniref:Rho-binding antiterminator n=1 Tax=Ferrimonas balearica TaxID=44012 RepID=UPI001C96026E|nr:Rho-binding antiterminator [Ferrimonas balearica]MBY5981844.1 Rho-binding antiterminator [Ferrimonas balearica]